MFSGRRLPSCDGMSRMMREYHVRFCEGLGVKFPGPTRQLETFPALPRMSVAGGKADAIGMKADVGLECRLLGLKQTCRRRGRRVCL